MWNVRGIGGAGGRSVRGMEGGNDEGHRMWRMRSVRGIGGEDEVREGHKGGG